VNRNDRLMRILAVTNMYPTPSKPALGIFVEEQVKGLRGVGIDVEVLFVDRAREGVGAYLHIPELIRSRLRAFAPDIVHVMYGGVMADIVTQTVNDRPVVVTFHGADVLGEPSVGPWRKLVAAYGVRSSFRAARRAAGAVVVGRALQEALPRDIDRSKIRIIPCGIDLARFRPLNPSICREQLNWPGDHFRVLFNSNGDDPVKQPALARAAVEALNRLGIRSELRELRGLPNHLVPAWLNASDVLLLTSLQEGSPTIVKEALACNVPIVSVDVGDVRDQLRGIEGCHLASADPEELAAKLRLVHARPSRLEARFKMEELSVERTALRLRDFYQELLAPASGNRNVTTTLAVQLILTTAALLSA